MMGENNLDKCLGSMRVLVQVAEYFYSCPISWRSGSSELIVPISQSSRKSLKCSVVRWLSWGRTMVISGRLIMRSTRKALQFSNGSGVVAVLWVVLNLFCSFTHLIFAGKNGASFCQTFNTFIAYRRGTRQTAPIRRHVVHLCWLIGFIGVAAPLLYPPIALIDPCGPQYVGSLLIDCSDPGRVSGWGRLFVYGLEVILFGCQSQTAAMVYVAGILLLECLNRSTRSLQKISSVTFTRRQARLYREGQVLLAMHNQCFKLHLLPNIQFLGCAAIISSLYAQIRYHRELPFVFIFFLNYLNLCTVTSMVYLLDGSSWVMLISRRILLRWRSSFYHTGWRRPAWFRTFARSCPELKVYSGPFHPVGRDRLAVVGRFCMQRATFLLYASGEGGGTS